MNERLTAYKNQHLDKKLEHYERESGVKRQKIQDEQKEIKEQEAIKD